MLYEKSQIIGTKMNWIIVKLGLILVILYGLIFDSHYEEKWWWWMSQMGFWGMYFWGMSKELYQLIKDWRDEKNKS